MTVQSYQQAPSVSTPTPVHSHTELSPVATVRRWAAQHGVSYRDVLDAVQYYDRIVYDHTPFRAAIRAAAEQLAGAERIAQAVAYAGRQQWKPVSASGSGYVTAHYKFAPSSHKSKRVKHCKLCEKQGKLCHIHAKRQAVAA